MFYPRQTMRRWLSTWMVSGCAACAPQPEPAAVQRAAATPTRPPAASATPAVQPAEAASVPEPTRERFPGAAFPPPDVAPPHPASAGEGDGRWVALGSASLAEHAAAEPHLLYRTVIHPHHVSRWKKVTIVAIDLERARLELVAGTDEPESKEVPADKRPGVVPEGDLPYVLAAFNGSWQARHGRYGMMKDGVVFLPPREDACTVALHQDGRVTLRSWTAIAPNQVGLAAWRQAPSCILEQGALHPELEQRNERRWGGLDPKTKTRRRSAIALDATGRVFFFGLGEEVGPRELAEGLRVAGAQHAAQLDINYYWTRFLLFGRPKPDAPLQVTSTLIPKLEHRKRGYVSLPEPRDFFYVARRTPE